MDNIQVLKNLCTAIGVAGLENNASLVALDYIKEYASDSYIDEFNNVIAWVKKPKKNQKTLLIDAHIDEIGLIVTAIDDGGFLKVANCGGIDRRLVLGQEIIVHSHKPIKGVICTLPPHLSKLEDVSKTPEITSISIDVGMSKKEAEELINLGDRVTIKSKFIELLNNRISSKALDDRACVAIILNALSKIDTEKLNCGLCVLFSAQEETGERGAHIASYNINADAGIMLDVSFAHTPDADKNKCGIMGKGVMIGVSPTLDKQFSKTLLNLAEENNIPYQTEIMGGKTGTNADVIGTIRGGVRTALLSLPLKYMHTPVEVIDMADFEATAELLAKFIEQYE